MPKRSFFRRNRQMELATLGDVGFLLQSDRGTTALSRLRSDNFEQNAVVNKISNEVKETLYFFETMTYGGINNTSSKLFSSWFYHDSPEEGETIDPMKKKLLNKFHREIQLKPKMTCLANDSMAYGNGYFELIPAKPYDDPKEPIFPEYGLKTVEMLDPLFMQPTVEWIDQKNMEFYYTHRDKRGGEFKLHNSRVVHVPWATLGTMMFGRGVIEIGIRTMLAKIGLDWALGEVMYRYGKPFVVINIEEASKKELKKAYEILQNLNPNTGFAGTERHKFQMLNPQAINPDPFVKFYHINQARALEMPYMIFIGVQKGQVSGSKVDFSDWYQTLHSKQEIKFTAPIHTINNYFLKGNWEEEIFWNPIHIDDKAEWEINLDKAKYIDLMYRQNQLLIDEEARQLARDMGLPFPKDDKIWESEEEEPEEEPEIPEKPDKTEDFVKRRDDLRKQNLIERLKDAEFLAEQELFNIDRRQ